MAWLGKFRFSLFNLCLMFVPLALTGGAVVYFVQQQRGVGDWMGVVASVMMGIPAAVGALISGGKGLSTGLMIGFFSLFVVPHLVFWSIIAGAMITTAMK